MRLRNVKNKDEILNNSKIFIANPEDYVGHWQDAFENKQDIHIEIGMGKGRFIVTMAKENPDINFIGIEKYDSVIARALEKVEYLPNLRIVRMDAKIIDTCFHHEVSRVYLNFSDPWPKKRHHDRRLTSSVFLKKYDAIFKGDALIIQKTDNRDLFQYSLVSLSMYGYTLQEISLDLYKDEIQDNVATEYEERFSKQGFPIYRVVAFKKDA